MEEQLRDGLEYKIFRNFINGESYIFQIGAQIDLTKPLHGGNVHMLKGVFERKEDAQERLDSLLNQKTTLE